MQEWRRFLARHWKRSHVVWVISWTRWVIFKHHSVPFDLCIQLSLFGFIFQLITPILQVHLKRILICRNLYWYRSIRIDHFVYILLIVVIHEWGLCFEVVSFLFMLLVLDFLWLLLNSSHKVLDEEKLFLIVWSEKCLHCLYLLV